MRDPTRYKRLLQRKDQRRQRKYLNEQLERYKPTDVELQMSSIVVGDDDPLDQWTLEEAMQDLHFLAYCREHDISHDDCNLSRHYAAFMFENQTGRKLYPEDDTWTASAPSEMDDLEDEQELNEKGEPYNEWIPI